MDVEMADLGSNEPSLHHDANTKHAMLYDFNAVDCWYMEMNPIINSELIKTNDQQKPVIKIENIDSLPELREFISNRMHKHMDYLNTPNTTGNIFNEKMFYNL